MNPFFSFSQLTQLGFGMVHRLFDYTKRADLEIVLIIKLRVILDFKIYNLGSQLTNESHCMSKDWVFVLGGPRV
jgi:hypothetical protein